MPSHAVKLALFAILGGLVSGSAIMLFIALAKLEGPSPFWITFAIHTAAMFYLLWRAAHIWPASGITALVGALTLTTIIAYNFIAFTYFRGLAKDVEFASWDHIGRAFQMFAALVVWYEVIGIAALVAVRGLSRVSRD